MADSSYQFQVGDLVEYRPGGGRVYAGRIVVPYGLTKVFHDGEFVETRMGYAIEVAGMETTPNGLPSFAYASRLRLRPDLAAARADDAFQTLLHGILTAPRRGRRPKSPYAPVRREGGRHG